MKRESVSVFIPSSYRAARQARQNWTNPSAHRRLHDSFYMIDVSPWKHVFKNTRQIAACFQLMTSVIHENHEIKQRFCLFAFKVCFNLTAVCLHGAAGLRNSVAQVSEMQRLQYICHIKIIQSCFYQYCGCFSSFLTLFLNINVNVNVKINVLEYPGCRCWSNTSVWKSQTQK